MPVYQLSEDPIFPPPHLASKSGLLAVGGDLSRIRLLRAYSMGIFPWYSEGEPILWWSPDPRLVLYPDEFKVSRSLAKTIKKGIFKVTMDHAFKAVISQCAQVRLENDDGTWIVDDMVAAYCDLHAAGFAHSVEAWYDNDLAGGLYSMFTRVTNASKVSLAALVDYLQARSFAFIDCQIATGHLISLGAREIARARYIKELVDALQYPTLQGPWTFDSRGADSGSA